MAQTDRLKEIMGKQEQTPETAKEKEGEKPTVQKTESDPALSEAAKRLNLEPTDKKKQRFTIALDLNTARFVRKLAKDNETTISDVIAKITKDFVKGVS